MKCQLTGTPEQQIDPPEYEDDSQSPYDLAKNFLEGNDFVFDLYDISDYRLSKSFTEFVEIYRRFKFDQDLTRDENRGELLLLIEEFLIENIAEYIK